MTPYAALVHGDPVPRSRVDALLAAVPTRDNGSPSNSVRAAPRRDAGRIDMRLRRVGATSHNAPAADRRHIAALPQVAALSPHGLARAERQRRRWATQVVVADELARRACADRGLKPPEDATPPRLLPVAETDVADLGSIVAATLAHSPAARTLLTALEAAQEVPETAVRDYYDRNPDRFLTPEALRRGVDPFGTPAPADFLPYAQVRAGIAGELRRAAGRRAFFDWLDRAREGVVYAAGHEHPGDPSHPDHEHRH
ncbi:peptidyl-prolyl cis-trans isomerase [Streptomyces sp. TRM68367]|uniref:peptidyl-prolyl cis-trans isomerase n=1 Tax=Streptomyces sp. TRM68367 TaxID=2758415 RepID=UPI00165A4F3B|nr:peptidyl-prolyl cis-trans isomerase [Streptomyces sp. TRM68367]MBC9726246.1 peptidyl-prolyl cis-trans isomerase [Streptomyces sp. TRM68367]